MITFSCGGACDNTNGIYNNGQCITCASLFYATGVVNGAECICLTNFVWNTTSQAC
jgi:hypothetical protein